MYENVKYEIVPCPWSPLHWRNARLWWWWQHTCIIPAVATLYSVPGEHWRRCSAAYNDTMYTVFVLSSCHCRGSWPCLPGPHIRLPPRPQSWPDTMSGHYNQAYDDGGEPGAQEIGRRGHIVSSLTKSGTFEHLNTGRQTNERMNGQKDFCRQQWKLYTFSVYLYFSPQYPIFLPSSGPNSPEALIMIIC